MVIMFAMVKVVRVVMVVVVIVVNMVDRTGQDGTRRAKLTFKLVTGSFRNSWDVYLILEKLFHL